MALAHDASDADDLVQETLRRALTFLQRGSEIRDMRRYLFGILHNVQATQMRAAGRAHLSIDDYVDSLVSTDDPHRNAELKALWSALEELPTDHREVLLLVCLEGFAYREAASILGVPIGTVMSRLARARRSLIRKVWGEPEGAAAYTDGEVA